jgi:hypothetical protein
MMQNHNIAVYKRIVNNSFTVTGTSTKLFDLIETLNPNYKKNLGKNREAVNAFRVYVISGTLGIMLDGSPVTPTSYLGVEETQHFIENCDLNKVQFAGIGGDATFVLQISHIG